MRIGMVIEAPLHVGGGFQQTLTTMLDLKAVSGHEVVALTPLDANLPILRDHGIEAYRYRFGSVQRLLARAVIRHPALARLVDALPASVRRRVGPYDEVLKARGIHLAFFSYPSLPQYVRTFPYIATVYDLCHRDWPELPEVAAQFEARERAIAPTLARAVAVMVSSRSLGEAVCRHYGVKEARLVILPFAPAVHTRGPAPPEEVARVREKFNLTGDYVFYPAQFWAHKNHVYLLEGLKALETTEGIRIDVVFSGSDFGNKRHVRETAERLGLADRVHFIGFVDDADMAPLYTGARALVMPTYFGPTNVPPFEAMTVGRPVIYSDLPDFREDLGDAALYCDLGDPGSLAAHLKSVLMQPELVDRLVGAGYALLQRNSAADHIGQLRARIDEFARLRRRWG